MIKAIQFIRKAFKTYMAIKHYLENDSDQELIIKYQDEIVETAKIVNRAYRLIYKLKNKK